MKLLVTTDAHVYKTPDQNYWCPYLYGYEFWTRYLDVFDEICIVSRVMNVNHCDNSWLRVDGDKVKVYGIPFFQGPSQLIKKFCKIYHSIGNMPYDYNAVLFRMPSPLGELVYEHIKSKKIPMAIELVANSKEMSKNDSSRLVRFIYSLVDIHMKSICKYVNGVAYVTQNSLQQIYPSHARLYGETEDYFETYYSTAAINKKYYGTPKKYIGKTKYMLVHVDVAMNSHSKGEIIVLQIVKNLRELGVDVSVKFIGDGSLKKHFEEVAKQLGILENVYFLGRLSKASEVRAELLNSDIFVFPTQSEGLPRSMIEAMAVGLPCISTPVGEIPYLLEEEFLFAPNNLDGFQEKVLEFIRDPYLLEKISENNIVKAREYDNDILQKRRNSFYSKLANCMKSVQQ